MGSMPASDGLLALEPGRVVGLTGSVGTGMTRLGLSLMAEASRRGPVAFVDVRGWLCPLSAWESGIEPDRLAVVRCPDPGRWPKVVAALLEGIPAVYAEVPTGVSDALLRRLGALARNRRRSLLLRPLRGSLPSGLTHLRLEGQGIEWEGVGDGHGRLLGRRLLVEASGKATGGIPRLIEIEGGEDGADAVRVVPRLAPAAVVGSAATAAG
ncbi:MAG: hypothetical protein OES13_03065 [Acidimicrobiia bacterium]|nr:hypothetical protein [Acidimicrobiia bacterium]